MSDNETPTEPAPTTTEPTASESKSPEQSVILVSYPKIVFLYPALICALICGTYMAISGAKDGPEPVVAAAAGDADATTDADGTDEEVVSPGSHTAHVLARMFLLVLTVNLVVISFDFPRTTSLTLFFFIIAVCVILWMIFRLNPTILPGVTSFINYVTPFANATFYFLFALVMVALYIGVAVAARFDYWEVRPNELLHHHGVLSDLERFSAPNLRINKEINDVFEYVLLRSGRLILHPSNERRAIVLENVFFINRKEEQITRMLGALQVQVREQGPS